MTTRFVAMKNQNGVGAPKFSDRQPAERRAQRAAYVVADAVGRNRARQILFRNEHRQDREPGCRVQPPGGAEQKGGQQEEDRRRKMEGHERREDRDDRRHGRADRDDQASGIDDVDDRARRQGEQEHRQVRRRMDERNMHRVQVELRHQPARRRIVHRDPDHRRRACEPDDSESGMREDAEGAPAGRGRGGSVGALTSCRRGPQSMRGQHAAVGAEHQIPRHPPEGPFPETAVAERPGHDEVGVTVAGDFGELRGFRTPRSLRRAVCLDAMTPQPLRKFRHRFSRIIRALVLHDLDGLDPLHRAQKRKRIPNCAARLARILPTDERSAEDEARGSVRDRENWPADTHQQIAGLRASGGEDKMVPDLSRNDHKIDRASLAGDELHRRAKGELGAPSEVRRRGKGAAKSLLRRFRPSRGISAPRARAVRQAQRRGRRDACWPVWPQRR